MLWLDHKSNASTRQAALLTPKATWNSHVVRFQWRELRHSYWGWSGWLIVASTNWRGLQESRPTSHTRQKKKGLKRKNRNFPKADSSWWWNWTLTSVSVFSPTWLFPAKPGTSQLEAKTGNATARGERWASRQSVPVLPSIPKANAGLKQRLCFG